MLRSFSSNMFKRKLFDNKLLIVWAIFWILMLYVFTNVSFFSDALKMSSIPLNAWIIIAVSSAILVVLADNVKTRIKI